MKKGEKVHCQRPRKYIMNGTSLNLTDCIRSEEGETLENKIERIMNNGGGISEGAELAYTQRADGIPESQNVRTDKWDLAIEATSEASKSYAVKRAEAMELAKKPKDEPATKEIHQPGGGTTESSQ